MSAPHGTGTPRSKEDLFKVFPDISQSVITAAVTANKSNYAAAFGLRNLLLFYDACRLPCRSQ